MSEEQNKLSGHSYDGIEELDNNLPRWWLATLWGTVIFAAGYFFYYVLWDGPSLVTEYERAKRQTEAAQLLRGSEVKLASEDELRAIVKDPLRVHKGHDLFETRCVSCHGAQGQGGIGPNLTDDYWIHGGKLADITRTITTGVADKGMPPWGTMMSQDEIHSLVAFIRSIRGSNPPGAKAPQGDLFKE